MIFYFSATGNSQYVAEKLGQGLGEQTISIAEALSEQRCRYYPAKDEKIILVIPVYFYGLPSIVNDFLDSLQMACASLLPVYAVFTCGFASGDAVQLVAQRLEKHNIGHLRQSFVVRMPDNYILLFKAPSIKHQRKMLLRAEQRIEQIITAIKSPDMATQQPRSGFLSRMFTKLSYPRYLKGRSTLKFHSLDNCIGCGLCAQVCPIHAIRMENGRPHWQIPQCVHCLACLHHCPVEAAQYGKATLNKGRYLNPHIKK